MKIQMRDKMHKALPRAYKGGHVCYFSAAALGWHGVYATVAGVIVAVIAIAFVFKVDLE